MSDAFVMFCAGSILVIALAFLMVRSNLRSARNRFDEKIQRRAQSAATLQNSIRYTPHNHTFDN
jgi:ABC-type nickel/cobalt efflux system permease component RcnA